MVRDPAGRPLNAAEIAVGDSLSTLSDSKGEFTLHGVPTGTVQLDFRRIGYHPYSVGLQTQPGTTGVSVAATLVPNTTQVLGTVVIEGKIKDTNLFANGFYKRSRLATGTFFTPERMAHTAVSLGTMLMEVPQVKVARTKGNVTIPMGIAAYTMGGPLYCKLSVFLDGILELSANETGIDALIAQDQVRAIEVYPKPEMVPAQVRGLAPKQPVGGAVSARGATIGDSFYECGVILIWTKQTNIGSNSQ